ncbi:DUF6438 domain-containing protein [Snuella sedimenti]|uniref:DUF6438 domain-containing protein n=1 Tax=Snuella sedimenti TaxID=2798802 RepID=A0A8J7JCA6_9FLAO|nr:DUF6438 domain-containing protein [Snuella sedimenti]MBJ6368464.1 hypothetical protein [Snuella sedimenti]
MNLASYFKNNHKELPKLSEAFIKLSKGKSLNGCPVFDLWLFENGHVIYHGIDNVEKTGTYNGSVPQETIEKLKTCLNSIKPEDIGEAKGRDKALSILKTPNKKIVFQASKTKRSLYEINKVLEYIAENI